MDIRGTAHLCSCSGFCPSWQIFSSKYSIFKLILSYPTVIFSSFLHVNIICSISLLVHFLRSATCQTTPSIGSLSTQPQSRETTPSTSSSSSPSTSSPSPSLLCSATYQTTPSMGRLFTRPQHTSLLLAMSASKEYEIYNTIIKI